MRQGCCTHPAWPHTLGPLARISHTCEPHAAEIGGEQPAYGEASEAGGASEGLGERRQRCWVSRAWFEECWLGGVWFVSGCGMLQSNMGERERVLPGVSRRHRQLDASHADAYQGADLQQPEADRAAGRVSELRVCQADAAQGAEQHIGLEANHRRNWLARMVAAEVRSANRSS